MIGLVLAQAITAAPIDPSIVQAAAQAAVAAAAPQACPTVPASDTLNGTVGSGCYAPGNAARPTAVQRAYVTTASDGTWAVTFGRSFSAAPVVTAKPIMAGSTRGDCGVSAVSMTGASGTCWTYQTTVVSVLGATVNPIATAAAGVSVMLVAAQPTQ